MDLTDYFRFANLGVAIFMLIGGVNQFFSEFGSIIVGLYIVLFGGATASLEFQISPQIARYCSFYFSFLGRGIFYTFIAAIVMTNVLGTICGFVIGLIGIAYAALEFVPSVEPPANMRDQEAGWGAEGV